jgi:hypothetical protein
LLTPTTYYFAKSLQGPVVRATHGLISLVVNGVVEWRCRSAWSLHLIM